MTRRTEFTRTTKLAAWDRCGGRCECGCDRKLYPGDIEYDHRITCEQGGDNSLENCVVLSKACHGVKTHKVDAPRRAKSRSVRAKHVGADKPKRPMLGSRASGLKKRLDGTVIRRPE